MEILTHYLIPLVFLAALVYALLVMAKVHANARSVDAPDAILNELRVQQGELARTRAAVDKLHHQAVSAVIKAQDEGYRRLIDDSVKRSELNEKTQVQLIKILAEQSARFAEIEAVLNALRTHASNADQQIRRFQEGYNYSVNKVLILGIIRTIDEIEDEVQATSHGELLYDGVAGLALGHLEVLLANEFIVPIVPAEGEEYSKWRQYAKARPIATDRPDLHNRIARVTRRGYRSDTGADQEDGQGSGTGPMIRIAEVEVYQFAANREGVQQ